MPSSPIASPVSPPPLEYVELAKNQRVRRSLEWACAAARLAEKEGVSLANSHSRRTRTKEHRIHQYRHRRHNGCHDQQQHPHHRHKRPPKADTDLTEDESDELVPTPTGSWINDDDRWVARPDGAIQAAVPPTAPKSSQETREDDIMRAALALCGLGRRS